MSKILYDKSDGSNLEKFDVDNEKMGIYLAGCIDKSYKTRREFCRKYLKLRDGSYTNDDVVKMSNRLSQILKGKKMIQSYDLLYFSRLLNISCEEIISGGEYVGPITNRVTSYTIASSDEPEKWEEYIELREKLNMSHDEDEYGKTLMDYAIELENDQLINYLINREKICVKSIYLDDENKVQIAITADDANSIIKKRRIGYVDSALISEMSIISSENIRQEVIGLAAKNNDMEMLKSLKARELSELHVTNYISGNPDISSSYNEKTIKYIGQANEEVLDYFTVDFVIADSLKHENHYMYPYLSELIDELISNNCKKINEIIENVERHV